MKHKMIATRNFQAALFLAKTTVFAGKEVDVLIRNFLKDEEVTVEPYKYHAIRVNDRWHEVFDFKLYNKLGDYIGDIINISVLLLRFKT